MNGQQAQVLSSGGVMERVHTAMTMAGSGLGAIVTTSYSATFLDSNVAMAMGMIGAIGGALLATVLTPFAFSRHQG